MLAFLRNLLSHSNRSIGTVVHIGAGVGSELELYNSLNFSQVVAVEPDPTLFNKLSRKAKRYNHVLVQDTWIATQTGATPIHCFANPRFNSLLAPDQLETHFSNLKQSEQKTAKAVGVNELIAELGPLDSKQSHLLVLDVQGAEALLLEACSQETLAQFEWVVVRTSEETLYKDSVTANALAKTLATRDLTLRFSDDENTPFTEHYYQRDQNAITIRQTEAKLHESQQKNKEINARCVEIEKAHEQAKKDLADLGGKLEEQSGLMATKDTALKEKAAQVEQFEQQVNSLSKQLEEKNKQAEESSKRLQEQKQALGEQLDAQKQAAQAQQEKTKQAEEATKQLQEQKQTLVEQLDAQKQAAIELTKSEEAKVNELKSELAAINKELGEQTHWHHENKKWAKGLENQLNEKIQNHHKLQTEFNQISSISNKMQLKAKVDLDSLRKNYQKKVESEKQLIALVKQLKEKLEMAASYYFRLQKDFPELDEKNIPDLAGRSQK